MTQKNNGLLKLLLDFLPIFLFFVAYKFPPYGIKPLIFASSVGIIATLAVFMIVKLKKIKLEKLAFYSNIAFVVFAGMTVFFDNPDFVKAKLTILNGILGVILLFFFFTKKPFIKTLFQEKIEMKDDKWNALNLRFGIMFFCIAILNFYFWKFHTDEVWVNFKTFGVLPFILLFFIMQFRFIIKNGKIIAGKS